MRSESVNRLQVRNIVRLKEWQVRSGDADRYLVQSIRQSGILQPLVVLKTDRHFLVDGFRRIALTADDDVVPVRIYDQAYDAFQASLLANMSVDPYTEMEKARAVLLVRDVTSAPEHRLLKEIMPAVGMRGTMEVLSRIQSFGNLTEAMRTLLTYKSAPLMFAEQVSRESAMDQDTLARWCVDRRLSLSRLMEAFDLLFYIRKRSGGTIDRMLGSLPDSDPIPALRRRRFPQISKRNEQVQTIARKHGGKLHFPPDFAGGAPRFEVLIQSREDVAEAIAALQDIQDDDQLFTLISELRGDD